MKDDPKEHYCFQLGQQSSKERIESNALQANFPCLSFRTTSAVECRRSEVGALGEAWTSMIGLGSTMVLEMILLGQGRPYVLGYCNNGYTSSVYPSRCGNFFRVGCEQPSQTKRLVCRALVSVVVYIAAGAATGRSSGRLVLDMRSPRCREKVGQDEKKTKAVSDKQKQKQCYLVSFEELWRSSHPGPCVTVDFLRVDMAAVVGA